MKKIIMIIGMAIATIGFSYANNNLNIQGQEQMTPIDKEELPGNVRASLETEFMDWEVQNVFEVEEGASAEGAAYAIEVQREGETMMLHYDSDGNLVKQEKKEEGYQHESK